MNRIYILLSTLLFFFFSTAQEKKDSAISDIREGYAESVAEFPGGNRAWLLYLERNLNHSLGYKYLTVPKGEKFAKQTVIVLFEIDREGRPTNITVENLNTVHPELAKEAIHIIAASPLWKPAYKGGRLVSEKHRQKISFVSGSFP